MGPVVLAIAGILVAAAMLALALRTTPAPEHFVSGGPRTHFLTFGEGECYAGYARKLAAQATTVAGFHAARALDKSYVDERFRARNSGLLQAPRGNGYWLWKPYAILRYALEECNEGDVIVYVDSLFRFQEPQPEQGFAEWVRQKLARDCPDDLLLMRHKPEPNNYDYREREWCKADTYVVLGVADRNDFKDSVQVWAGFVALRRGVRAISLVAEWLAHCQDPRAVDDSPGVLERREDPELREHRHDQSVLSLLAKKRGVAFHEFPKGYMLDLRHAYEGSC